MSSKKAILKANKNNGYMGIPNKYYPITGLGAEMLCTGEFRVTIDTLDDENDELTFDIDNIRKSFSIEIYSQCDILLLIEKCVTKKIINTKELQRCVDIQKAFGLSIFICDN